MSNVIRVDPATATRLRHRKPGDARLGPVTSGTVKVVCAPFMARRSDVHLHVTRRHDQHWYRWNINVDDGPQRMREILAAMDRSGATIGVLPEVSIDPGLIASWRTEILRTVRRASHLRVVVIGTGTTHLDSPWMQPHQAVLIDRLRGTVLGEQDKLTGSSMPKHDISRVGGPQDFGEIGEARWGQVSDDTVFHEEVQEGRLITIFEFPPQRLAVLICEDLEQVEEHVATLRAAGVTHVIVPVLSEALSVDPPATWEAMAAWVMARRVGAHVIVANSLALSAAPSDGGDPVFAFSYSPDASLGHRREPRSSEIRGRRATDTGVLKLA